MHKETNFIRRYFNNDPCDGMLGIGSICPYDMPAGLALHSTNYYSCTIVLSDLPDADLHAGDVFQSFPPSPEDRDAPSDIPAFPADALLFHICLGAHTCQALLASGLLCPDVRFHITLESYLDDWMPALIRQLKSTPQEDLPEVYLNIQKLTNAFFEAL